MRHSRQYRQSRRARRSRRGGGVMGATARQGFAANALTLGGWRFGGADPDAPVEQVEGDAPAPAEYRRRGGRRQLRRSRRQSRR